MAGVITGEGKTIKEYPRTSSVHMGDLLLIESLTDGTRTMEFGEISKNVASHMPDTPEYKALNEGIQEAIGKADKAAEDAVVAVENLQQYDERLEDVETKLENIGDIGDVADSEVVNKIQASVSQMELRIDNVTASISQMELNIDDVETRIDSVEDDVAELMGTVRDLTIYVGDSGNDNNDGESEGTRVRTFGRVREIANRKRSRQLNIMIIGTWTLGGGDDGKWFTLYPVAVVTEIRGEHLNIKSGTTVKFMPACRLNVILKNITVGADSNLFLGNGGTAVELHPDIVILGTGTMQFHYCILNFQPTTAILGSIYLNHVVALWINRAQRSKVASSSAGNLLPGAKSDYTKISTGTNLYVATT